MRIGVVIFPGSNGDHDALKAIELGLGEEVVPIFHKATSIPNCDALIVPGGFSYGDYLRAGAIARFSPVMQAVEQFVAQGGPVLGICNGFQILTEAGLLPGALLRNAELSFTCEWVYVRAETDRTPFSRGIDVGTVLRLPIAHGEGRYFATPEQVRQMEENDQIVFRYCDPRGGDDDAWNPNGSTAHIAGVCNERGNVVGLMPHPERAYDPLIGGDEGLRVLGSVVQAGMAAVRS
jgi:phosphoribosylformylglycinamidine synthase subunit PurQ / glutaminase